MLPIGVAELAIVIAIYKVISIWKEVKNEIKYNKGIEE